MDLAPFAPYTYTYAGSNLAKDHIHTYILLYELFHVFWDHVLDRFSGTTKMLSYYLNFMLEGLQVSSTSEVSVSVIHKSRYQKLRSVPENMVFESV